MAVLRFLLNNPIETNKQDINNKSHGWHQFYWHYDFEDTSRLVGVRVSGNWCLDPGCRYAKEDGNYCKL